MSEYPFQAYAALTLKLVREVGNIYFVILAVLWQEANKSLASAPQGGLNEHGGATKE